MKSLYALLFFVIATLTTTAQVITHGPIVGGVTDTSCHVFLRTSEATSFKVEVNTDPGFSGTGSSVNGATDPALDTIGSVTVTGLHADQRYYVRVIIGGNPVGDVTTFETFQSATTVGHQVFVAGSCIYDLTTSDSAIFVRAKSDNPKAFIQMGDWGYPDGNGWFDIYFTTPPTSWAKDYNKVRDLYKQRYVSPSHEQFIKSMAVDYVYDDHDYMNDAAGYNAVTGFVINPFQPKPLGSPEVWQMPTKARLNVMQGYREWFPGYQVVDTNEGIYHSFRSGNVEVFVMDLRSMRTPQANAIIDSAGGWYYREPANYSLLGANQMNWLLNGLQNSTATWKILISSDAYNLGGRLAVDTLLKIGNGNVPYWAPDIQGITVPNKGYTAVQNFADNWSGFWSDADTLLHHIVNNNIKNVYLISADSHTVGLDDGTNSGIPELNSGNLHKANSEDWVLYQQFMGFNMWNRGGSGLCDQDNFNNTFARIEVFGDDSIHLSAVDEAGVEVAGATFPVNMPYKYVPGYHPNKLPHAAADAVTMVEGDTATIAVLANDTDPENDNLFVNVKSGPAHGSVSMDNSNVLTYIPAAGFAGTDTVFYRACDNSNATCPNCSNSFAVITVNPETGVKQFDAAHYYRVFPTPADTRVTVQTNFTGQILRFELLTQSGQEVSAQNFTGTLQVNTSALATGTYLYQIRNGARLLKTGRLTVQHQ